MDDFWGDRNNRMGRFDPFWDDMFPSTNQSPFSILHDSMNRMQRDMDQMMRHAFGGFSDPFSNHPSLPNHPSRLPIENGQSTIKDKDLDKQVQQYGVNSIFDDPFNVSEYDFIENLKRLEKQPKTTDQPIGTERDGVKFYGKSYVYNYRSGDNKVEERKVVQDSRGNRLESVQRKLGDQIWARTKKQKEGGQVEEDEKMLNMNEDDKEKFMQEWRNRNRSLPYNTIPYESYKGRKDNEIDPGIDISVIDEPPKQLTLPSLEKKSSDDWFNKLKFWKR